MSSRQPSGSVSVSLPSDCYLFPKTCASGSATSSSGSTTAASTSTTFSSGPTTTASATQTSATTHTQSASPVVAAASSTSNAGTIAGCVVGGVVFLVLFVLAMVLYLRARKRKRTPPSSEFMNSIKAGATPVLRLDSGAEYTSALAEKGGVYTHYSPAAPLPSGQSSRYTSPPMQNVKFPDELVSGRPSVERPYHPSRSSSQQQVHDPFVPQHHSSTSIDSRREPWRSGTEFALGEWSPVRRSRSPRVDSVLHFAPRISLDGSSP